jgi:hypothetical protein
MPHTIKLYQDNKLIGKKTYPSYDAAVEGGEHFMDRYLVEVWVDDTLIEEL